MNPLPKRAYAHLYSDVREKMPILARGSNAAVYLTVGACAADMPTGVTVEEIANYTGLDRRTIESSLETLCFHKLVVLLRGKYTALQYIENKKTARIACTDDGQSINHQSNQSQSFGDSTENSLFARALQQLSGALLAYGGISSQDVQDFKELWTDFPDADLHERALTITRNQAKRPNYKYYAAVVRTGAKTTEPNGSKSKPASEPPLLEVLL